MWKKSRGEGEKLLEEDGENATLTKDVEKLETNLRNIEEVVKKYENEKAERLCKREKQERGEKEKRQKRSERLLLKKSLEEKWEMMRWLVKHLDDNEAQWETYREMMNNDDSGEMVIQIDVTQNGLLK